MIWTIISNVNADHFYEVTETTGVSFFYFDWLCIEEVVDHAQIKTSEWWVLRGMYQSNQTD